MRRMRTIRGKHGVGVAQASHFDNRTRDGSCYIESDFDLFILRFVIERTI